MRVLRRTVVTPLRCLLIALAIGQASQAGAQSVSFTVNNPFDSDYGLQTMIPAGFGDAEFTFEMWIRPDNSFPVGPVDPGTPGQRTNWSNVDNAPYSSGSWWFAGNFLLDGHNNSSFENGTFSLQFYGGGRVRWLFGDGVLVGPGGHWSVGAYPATNAPSLLDGSWHQLTLVRRWTGTTNAQLELWIDGVLIDTKVSSARTNMRTYWNSWSGFPSGQAGWFWGSEKQAAINLLDQYEDYKGLVDEIRFWSRAKMASEISAGYLLAVTGSEPGLVGAYSFNEGSGNSVCNRLNASQCIQLVNMKPGYWTTQNPPLSIGPNGFYTVTPCRVADTRNPDGPLGGPAISANSTRTFAIGGNCAVPATAAAAVFNIAVVNPTQPGNLRLYAAGDSPPPTSAINFSAGQIRANNATVRLGPSGQLAIQCDMPGGATHVVLDVMGYYR